MKPESDRLLKLAAAVLDGAKIDWEREESESDGVEERRLIRQLRQMAKFAQVRGDHDATAESSGADAKGAIAVVGKQGRPAASEASTKIAAPPSSAPGMVGDYRVIRKIGEGGMGVVYEAEQQHPRRAVALKVIRGIESIDDNRVRMFQREAQSLARLRHPGIAAIYESGRTEDGRHYFAMELVRGETLSHFLKKQTSDGLPEGELRLRLGLFQKICETVNYAHQRGVIHRDLKPSNILVLRDSLPSGEGDTSPVIPGIKILDFGLARITDTDIAATTILTDMGKIHGTLPYMSPEQVRGTPDEIDLRTDVYSLGVILYELLAGEYPYEIPRARLSEAVKIVCEEPPKPLGKTKPWKGRRRLDADVETIALKALEKEPARRYQSALALAEDVRRYLAGHPILARPPSAIYQLRKMVTRHKAPFGFAAVLVILLAGFAVSMTLQAGRIARERDRANLEAETSRKISDFLLSLFEVSDPGVARGNTITAREILDKGTEKIARELEGQALTQARLLDTMGNVYRSLGLYEQAVPLLEKAVKLKEGALGKVHTEVGRSLNNLGWLYTSQSRYAEARPLHERALTIFEQAFGPDHTDVAWSRYYLGSIFVRENAFAEARPLLERALVIFEKNLGLSHFAVSWCLNDLAQIYLRTGQYVEAKSLFERALKLKEQSLGPDHPDFAMALNNVGYALLRMEQYAEARPLLERAIAIQERTLGPNHPDRAISLHSLGELLRRMGNRDEARPLLERALAIWERSGGPDNPMAAHALNSLAGLLQEMGRFAEAEPLYQRALGIRAKYLGPDQMELAETMENYAALLRKLHRNAEAEKLQRRANATRAGHGDKPTD